jgi:hypothetical protein
MKLIKFNFKWIILRSKFKKIFNNKMEKFKNIFSNQTPEEESSIVNDVSLS